jgi:ATP-dependent Clp protease adaptor protein ClpS
MAMQTGFVHRASLFLTESGVNTTSFMARLFMERIVDLAETKARRTAAPAEVLETSSGRSDRWAVVLINDDHHSTNYVIRALLKTVPELTDTDATLIMLEAHNTGRGVVTVCGRGQAEEYRAALRLLQLGCEIEPGW